MQTILITGANRGIGLALAAEFLSRKYRVVATARRPDRAESLRRLSDQTKSDELIVSELDITNASSVTRLARHASETSPCLDVLINNAGAFPEEGDESIEDLNLSCFGAAFETNVVGAVRMCRTFLPLLRMSPCPRIVNVSSGAGSISAKSDNKYYCYSTSKAALNMFTRALANELKPAGIIVVALSPGWVRTEMGGPNAELEPEESARSIANTVANLTIQDAGHFLGRDGCRASYQW